MGKHNKNVLLRGPCDVMALYFYLQPKNIKLESAIPGRYLEKAWDVSNSIFLEQFATNNMIDSHFVEPAFYPNKEDIYSKKYKLIILSVISDGILGVYQNKVKGYKIAYGMHKFDATLEGGRLYREDSTIYGGISGISLNEYIAFSKSYQFLGLISPVECSNNFKIFIDSLPRGIDVCILLGPTFESAYGEMNPTLKGCGKEIYERINKEMYRTFSSYPNVSLVDPSLFYIKPKHKYQMFYYNFNSINHYPSKTYRLIAKEIHKLYPDLIKVSYKKACKRFFKRLFKRMIVFLRHEH